jgi:hypothetical protein
VTQGGRDIQWGRTHLQIQMDWIEVYFFWSNVEGYAQFLTNSASQNEYNMFFGAIFDLTDISFNSFMFRTCISFSM